MKISLNWLKRYIEIPVDYKELSDILTSLGLEVEGIDHFESVKGSLKGVVIGQVKECKKHPNADRLTLTQVDLGLQENLQIVCGAPNVREGQKVLVASVGTTLYPENQEPWTIKKGKIRGEFSEGMICAEDELGLGTDHSGILVLPEDSKVGTAASDYFEIENDVIYDIALTPNRSDATSHIGVAKDLAAFFNINMDHSGRVSMPDINNFKIDYFENKIKVEVEDPVGCPRYSGVSISGVEIKESPVWLKNSLLSIGLRPINNIVDITNFVLHEIGQPLHAFDADKIDTQRVVIKSLPKGSQFTTLDEEDRKLKEDDLMICNGDHKGMCIAGVFGGIGSGVTEETKNIFLESAHFNAKRIRKSSMQHFLRTDAALIFEKGSDPNITVYALKRAAMMINELAGGMISSEIIDVYPQKIVPHEVIIPYKKISNLIGLEIAKDKIHEILQALEIEISNVTEDHIRVKVPTNKTDVTREADVIEEILRIYGFNNIPVSNSFKSGVHIDGNLELHKIRKKVSEFLSSRGWYETMNLSLIPSKYYVDLLPDYKEQLIAVNNTSNVSLDVMRPELLLSALSIISYNQNRQQDDTRLFEFGNIYQLKSDDQIKESEFMSLAIKGNLREESWLDVSDLKVSYFDLKRDILALLAHFGLKNVEFSDNLNDKRFEYSMAGTVKNSKIVKYGKVNAEFARYFDIKGAVFFAEFNMKKIYELLDRNDIQYKEINKYPSTRRDLAIVLHEDVPFSMLKNITFSTEAKLITEINLFDVYRNEDQLGKNKKSYAVSFVFESEEKTLKDKEVDKIMNRLITKFEKNLAARIRQ